MNQAWRLWRNEDTMLAKFIRLKHCRQTEFLNTMSRTGSHSWKALIRGCNLLKTGLRWVVGTGYHINFWTDHWLPPGPMRGLIYGPLLSHEYVYRVERFINPNQQWDFSSLSMVLPDNITQHIVAQPLPISQAPHLNDIRAWQSSSGLCSVKPAYYFLMQNREESRVLQRESWGWIWKLKLPLRFSCSFGNVHIKGFLLTLFNLIARINTISTVHVVWKLKPRCMYSEIAHTQDTFGFLSLKTCSSRNFSISIFLHGVKGIQRLTPEYLMFRGVFCLPLRYGLYG